MVGKSDQVQTLGIALGSVKMLTAAKGVEAQQTAILDNLVDKFNLDLNRQLYPNLPFKLRDQWADASIKRDIYEAAYRKFVLKDPNATDYYAITPANLVTKRYGQEGSTRTPQADRIADKKERLERWVRNGMEGDIPNSQYPGVGMYEFYGGPGTDVVTEGGKHFTSSMEKTLKRIAKENNVKVEVLPVKIGDDARGTAPSVTPLANLALVNPCRATRPANLA